MIFKVQTIHCSSCNSFVYSRAQHDCRTCPCGSIFIDGGLIIEGSENNPYYSRVGGVSPDTIIQKIIDIHYENLSDTSEESFRKAAFDDWNLGKDLMGIIKDETLITK